MNILKHHIDIRKVKAVLTSQSKVIDAINIMTTTQKSFVILQDGNEIVGIFTLSDLKNRVINLKLDPKQTILSDVMTTDLNMFDLNDSLDECISRIGKKNIQHLPILNKGKLVAVIPTIKLLRLAFQELMDEREHLIHYINGDYAL